MLFVVSLFINALGVAFITKALLGTSPITSVNYVLSMFTPLTMGQWTILLNLSFVLLDLLFMTRRELRRERTSYLLQIPISLSFGLFIDFAMVMLFWLEPVSYAAKLLWLLVGCFILAAGIALEVRVNVAMTAGEYLVRAICRRHGSTSAIRSWASTLRWCCWRASSPICSCPTSAACARVRSSRH